MRRLTLLLFAICLVQFSDAQILTWSDAIVVGGGNPYGSSWPRIVLTDGDVPAVMWGHSGGNRIYVSRMNGSSFGTPVAIVPGSMEGMVADWAGPDIGAWGDSVYVVFKSVPEVSGYIYVCRSTDGGATFSDTIRVENISPDITRFPAIDVTKGGNPVVAFMRFDTNFTDAQYEIFQSNDGGQSFGNPTSGSGLAPGEVCDCCATDIHVEGSTYLLPFRNNDNNLRDTWLGYSANAGQSFDTIRMDYSGWNIASCPSQGPDATMKDDTVATVWATGAFGSYKVWISAADTASKSLSINQGIDSVSAAVTQRKPRIASKGDTVVVVWEDNRNGDYDIHLRWSVNGLGGVFQNKEVVNDSLAGIQMNPDVAFANGKFHVVYKDLASDQVMYRSATISNAVRSSANLAGRSFEVYPNPSKGNLTVVLPDSKSPWQLNVIDGLGRTIHQQIVISSEINLDLSEFSGGLYQVVVSNQETHLKKSLLLTR